jgi:hypothetical protein
MRSTQKLDPDEWVDTETARAMLSPPAPLRMRLPSRNSLGLRRLTPSSRPYGQQRQRDLGFVDEASANPLKVERMTVTLFTVRKTVDNIRV